MIKRLALSLLLIAMAKAVSANNWFSPNDTDHNDLSLPLGESEFGPWSIVIRRIDVPGTKFWLASDRFIDLGQGGEASVYERPVSVEIRGVTKSTKKWNIWLGKYEVTVGQYAYVMGAGDLRHGLTQYQAYNRSETQIPALLDDRKALSRFLAKPVQRLPPSAVSEFLRRLNQWCYGKPACRSQLPKVGAEATIDDINYLPFFRLPNEVEWEYAARGVSIKREKYRGRLPVSGDKLGNYAQLQKVNSIGSKKAIFGFYDLFGNVAELVDGRMSSEIGQLGVGAWLAKGGKAGRAFTKLPYSSLREEINEFEWEKGAPAPEPTKFSRIGFRVALGTPLQAFTALAQRERLQSSRMEEGTDAIESNNGLTKDFSAILDSLTRSTSLDRQELVRLNDELESALERLQNRERKVNVRMAGVIGDNTLTKLVRIWAVYSRVLITTEQIEKYPDDGTLSDRRSAILERLKLRNTQDLSLIDQLRQEYEIAIRALADIPGVTGKTVTVDLKTFEQSEKTALMAVTGLKLVRHHVNVLQAGASVDIPAEIIIQYPF